MAVRLLSLALTAAALSATAAQVTPTRETIPFDFGWRWHLGQPGGNSSCDLPLNLTGRQCHGLAAVPSAESAAECAAVCCAQYAAVWQWCTVKGSCGAGRDCWVGTPTDECTPSPEWTSWGRNGSNPAVPAPALNSFDDSAWSLVDSPHDALIETPPRQNGTNNGQGSIAKNVTWYRKHFALPAEWEGSHVSIYFEGVFSVATAWLNGVLIAGAHDCGYTSFAVRLDNVSGVAWGAPNVLALFVDATVTTGWWYEGGGLFRQSHLVRSPRVARIADDGVFAPAFISGAVHTRATPALGLTSDSAVVAPSISLESPGNSTTQRGATSVTVQVALYAAGGTTLVVQGAKGEWRVWPLIG